MPYGSRSDRRRNLRGAVYGRAVPFYVRRAITSSLSIRVYRYRRYLYSNHGIRRNDMLSHQIQAHTKADIAEFKLAARFS